MLSTLKKSDFSRNVSLSLLAHLVLLGGAIIVNRQQFQKIDLSSSGTQVMWAEIVSSPPKTDPNKLPGPVVTPPPAAKSKEKKVVLEDSKNKTQDKETKNSLQDALAGLDLESDVAKATPRPDNFASDGEGKKTGLPTSPLGGGTSALVQNPEFLAYRNQIVRLVSSNLVWLREDGLTAKVSARIDAGGGVHEVKLFEASENPSFGQACIRAVKKSSPLPAPPEKFRVQLTAEEFVFQCKR